VSRTNNRGRPTERKRENVAKAKQMTPEFMNFTSKETDREGFQRERIRKETLIQNDENRKIDNLSKQLSVSIREGDLEGN
jgi:hypothetical protein